MTIFRVTLTTDGMPADDSLNTPFVVPQLTAERAAHSATRVMVAFVEIMLADVGNPDEEARNWFGPKSAGNTILDMMRDVSMSRWSPDRLRALVMAWLTIAPADDLAAIEAAARQEIEGYQEFRAREPQIRAAAERADARVIQDDKRAMAVQPRHVEIPVIRGVTLSVATDELARDPEAVLRAVASTSALAGGSR